MCVGAIGMGNRRKGIVGRPPSYQANEDSQAQQIGWTHSELGPPDFRSEFQKRDAHKDYA